MDYRLQELEKKSIYILREAKIKFKNIAILFSMGKDSTTCLFLCKRAFWEKIPFPVIHLDNGHDLPGTYQFRNKLVKELGINLIVAKIDDGLSKTDALKKTLEKYKFDALITPIKKNYHPDGVKETYIKVHPLFDWTELDIWQYIKEKNIPVPAESSAKTVDEIIEELKANRVSEKQGRIKNREEEEVLERLRKLGYL
jgi:sulfate adenylyltransferase subunit 2